ncbi:MAG TPA: nucleotidyl transferase AbiEii/AbiGii toxin family protein [Nakamurella sp.]
MTGPRRPTRATTAGRAYLDLQNLARRRARPTDELHQLYALEGFLARLAISPHADRLVLKGGALLAAYGSRRPTRDIDLQARSIQAEHDQVRLLVSGIAALDVDDGLVFDAAAAAAYTIRDDDEYSGVRVKVAATLANARLSLHVDVNVGDPIWPAPATVEVPRLLGGSITVAGYPLPMVLAEKTITALQRGTANTRWRDFADIYLLTRRHRIDGADLRRCLLEVSAYRRVAPSPLGVVLEGYPALGQQGWAAWRRRSGLGDLVPASFADLLAAVVDFADPVLVAVEPSPDRWDPDSRRWV